MPLGYLVVLGDGSLESGDTIVGVQQNFTTASTIGTGAWTWSGVWDGDGTYYSNITDTGTYYLGTDGNVWFVPDTWNITSNDGSTASTAPSWSPETTDFGTSGGDDLIGGAADETFHGGATTGTTGTGNDTITAGAGDDTVLAGDGADTVYGGAGVDSIDGGDGDDVLHGDSPAATTSSAESLNWTAQGGSGTDISAGFTQVSGEMEIRVDFANDGANTGILVDTATQYTEAGDPFSANSGLRLTGTGGNNVSTVITFDAAEGSDLTDEVSAVVFRLTDVDFSGWQDVITITAWDAAGNPVAVTLTAEDPVNDIVSGQTVTATNTAENSTDAAGSVLVEVAGPVHQILIDYDNGGTSGQLLQITDIHFSTIVGDLVAGDTISGGAGNDMIFGGAGDDSLDGGAGDDTIDGQAGNDSLFGFDGNDTLYGGTGDDYVDGDEGTDSLVGGDGADTIVGDGGTDSIDGGAGTDSIYAGADDDTVYGGADNDLVFLDTGNDTFGDWGTEGGNDTVYGGDGDDSLNGGAGDDALHGDAGNDTLTGYTGTDTLYGGEGSDEFWVTDDHDVTNIYGGEDTGDTDWDSVWFSNWTTTGGVNVTFTGDEAGTYLFDGATASGSFEQIEAVGGTANADTINASADTSGMELWGQTGDDTVTGGSGDDVIHGGDGFDTITGGGGADTLRGGADDGLVYGGDGDDFIDDVDGTTTAGSQTIYGGAGNDIIYTGLDADTVEGGAGDDTLHLESDGDADVIILADGFGSDTITGFDSPTPNGDGTFTGIDTFDVTGLTDGTRQVYATDVVVTDDGAGNALLTMPNGESVTLVGIAPATADNLFWLTAVGFPMSDGTVEGTAGSDTINASYTGDPDGDMVDDGDAILPGDTGDDDLIYGYGGADTIRAEAGNDEVYGGTEGDFVLSGSGDDTVYGDAGDDEIFLESGNDTAYGGDGADTVHASTGADLIYGGAGDDSLSGGGTSATGHDTIHGDDGNDTLNGGAGNNSLYGGAGDDSIIWTGAGNDTIEGGETGETTGDILDASGASLDLTVDLSAVNAADPESGTITNGTETATFIEIEAVRTGSGSDSVIGSTGADDVATGAGADTLDMGAGADIADLGSDGEADTYVLADGDGSDTITGFDAPTDNGDGTFTGIDTFDVTALTDAGGDPVNTHDVTVVDDGSGNAVLSFPNGESVTLIGIAPATADDPFWLNAVGIPLPDGTVSGTAGDDIIDASYTGDPDGDLVDDGDAVILGHGADDDLIEAGAGNDVIEAGAGDDTIYGGDDVDAIIWSDGDGSDIVDGGSGGATDVDYIDASGATADLTLDLSAGDPANGEDGTLSDGTDVVTFSEIEIIGTGSGADSVIGSTDADTVDAGDGTDTLDMGAGDDVVDLGSDAVVSTGGGGGSTTVYDGAADTYVFSDGDGSDAVYGFEAPTPVGDGTFTGNDRLDVSGLTDGNGHLVTVHDVVVTDDGSGNAVLTFPGGESLTLYDIPSGDAADPFYLNAIGIPMPDGTIEGTTSADVIDTGYTGDPDGDMVDNGDAVLPGAAADDDLIEAYGGSDSIDAGIGDDTVYAGSGNDSGIGGLGDDTLYGESGNDELYGGEGDDVLDGETGDDTIFGYEGSDTAFGGDGNDYINTRTSVGTGLPDVSYPGSGFPDDPDPANDMDVVYGGEGDDEILTGDDDDSVYGSIGADSIDAGFDDDFVSAGDDDDFVSANEGADTVYGGDGNDTIHGDDASGTYSSLDIEDDAGDQLTGNQSDTLFGGAGNDTIYGMDDADVIDGGSGDDLLDGGIDDDTITGGIGADTIIGGEGDDRIIFAEGDSVSGGSDDDTFVLTDYAEAGTGPITIDGGGTDETSGGGDTLQLGDLADLSTLNITSTTTNASGNTSHAGTVTLDDGSVLTFSEIENIICFTPGIRLATVHGLRAIEDLRPGDLVVTRDHGLQPIRWTGRRRVPGQGKLAPVRIRAGVLTGQEHDLVVSPQHRMLFSGYKAELLYGDSEVLAPALHLVDGIDVIQEGAEEVEYIHILFDRHEIVFAEGAATESYHPGDFSLGAIEDAAREELFAIFPELRADLSLYGDTARRCLKRHEAQLLRG